MNDRSLYFVLSRYELEWLRCFAVSSRRAPVLPDDVMRMLTRLELLAQSDGRTAITDLGREVLERQPV